MLKLWELTVAQDRTLSWHSVMSRAFREMVRLDTLPFGMLWWDYVPGPQEAN